MSEQESNHIRRIVSWGIIGWIAVIGLRIALSRYSAPWRPGGFHYPLFFFFFPFEFGGLGAIFMILIVFFIARRFFGPWRGGGGAGDGYYWYPHQQEMVAASIVRQKYAKGEITKEQFQQMLHDLAQHEDS